MSNKELSKTYDVAKNTPLTWVKNKDEMFKAYEAGHRKRESLKTAEFEGFYQSDMKLSLLLD